MTRLPMVRRTPHASDAADSLPVGWDAAWDWTALLADQFGLPYFRELNAFLRRQRKTETVYPDAARTFAAFARTPRSSVRVVLVGQDPYHEPGQAHGLCFSVPRGACIPPSLRNIRRELADDVGAALPAHGDLTAWAIQGVLLLNTVLTVAEGKPLSHRGQGWERFTSIAIERISAANPFVVFLLWGKAAGAVRERIESRHAVITAAHPSPLAAHRGFFGSRVFSRCNEALVQRGAAPIRWEALE